MGQGLLIPAEARRFAGLEGILVAFRDGVRRALCDNLVAIYVTGSLLMGDFEEASSDLDFLVVTRHPLSASEVDRIALMHEQMLQMGDWGNRLEGGYAAWSVLRPWGIDGHIVVIEPGAGAPASGPSGYSADNMLAIRDHSLTLYGLAARAILPPVDRDVFTAALRAYANEFVARPGASELSAAEVASWTLNIARCLYGLETGRPCTKKDAATWLTSVDPTLAPILLAALAVRRGTADVAAGDTLRAGFTALQNAVARWDLKVD